MFLLSNLILSAMVLLIFLCGKRINNKMRIAIYLIIVILFSLLMGFRPLYVADTTNYINKFLQANDVELNNINFLRKYDGLEYGFWLLSKAFGLLSNNYRLFFVVISAAVTLLCVFGFAGLLKEYYSSSDEKYDYLGFSLLFFLSYYGLSYAGIAIRAGLAIGLGINAFVQLKRNKFVSGIVLLGLAFSFQRVSAIFLIIYLFYTFGHLFSKRFYFFVWGVCGILMFSGIADAISEALIKLTYNFLIGHGVSGYTGYFATLDSRIGVIDVFWYLIFGVMLYLSKSYMLYQKYINVFMLCIFIITFFHSIRAVSRAYDFTIIFTMPLLFDAYYGERTRKVNYHRYIVIVILMCYAIVMYRTQLKIGME